MRRKILSNLKGQTLIETVIALAVVLILVSALISVSISSVRSATLSRNKTTAAQLAYSQSELVRSLRDDPTISWSVFISAFNANCVSPSVCHVAGNIFVSGSTPDLSNKFTISITNPTAATTSQLNYTVSVTWTDSLGLHTETVSSILTPWK